MKYASTMTDGGAETVVVALPLGMVPLWDPQNPAPGTYPVPDEVGPGWVRDGDSFVPPPGGEGGE